GSNLLTVIADTQFTSGDSNKDNNVLVLEVNVIQATAVPTKVVPPTNTPVPPTIPPTVPPTVPPTQPATDLAITSIVINVNPASHVGECPVTFTFTASVTANGPGTITYRWEHSD